MCVTICGQTICVDIRVCVLVAQIMSESLDELSPGNGETHPALVFCADNHCLDVSTVSSKLQDPAEALLIRSGAVVVTHNLSTRSWIRMQAF